MVELQQECFEELKSVILTTALSRGGVFRDVNQVERQRESNKIECHINDCLTRFSHSLPEESSFLKDVIFLVNIVTVLVTR